MFLVPFPGGLVVVNERIITNIISVYDSSPELVDLFTSIKKEDHIRQDLKAHLPLGFLLLFLLRFPPLGDVNE